MEENAIPLDENGVTDTVVEADPVVVNPDIELERIDA